MANQSHRLRAVTTLSPMRMSLAGGGTDIPSYFVDHGGAVVSAAINQYVYVTVKRHSSLYGENYRLSYFKTEHVNELDEIENDIARECLRLVPIDPPLFMATVSDLPTLSGLGSSSSFAVGLLYALHLLRGENVSAGQLAEEACRVEIEILKRPIGKQDQYAAAFGGLNYIAFRRDGRVEIDPLVVPNGGIAHLFESSMLFWTGSQRDASTILGGQVTQIPRTSDHYAVLHQLADACRDEILRGPADLTRLAALLDAGWKIKRRLSTGISTRQIDEWYEKALSAGALGGKILGAGGGGFLYLLVPPECQDRVRAALSDMVDVRIGYDARGARILSEVRE